MKLKEILIALGFVLATVVAYRIGLLDLQFAVTGILVEIALAWILSKIIKEKQIEPKELAGAIAKESDKAKEKEELLKHSKLLVDKNLRFRTNLYVGFTYQYDLNLCIKGEPTSYEAYDYEKYLREADDHLERGYWNEVWKYGQERDSLIDDYNNVANPFLKDIVAGIIRKIKQNVPEITEWDGAGQPPATKYVFPEYLSFDVGYVLQYSFERVFDIDTYCVVKQEGNKWKISINRVFAESNNENDVQQFKQMIKASLNDSTTRKSLKKLVKYQKNIKEKHSLLNYGIAEIIKAVENEIPLKGRCHICDEIHGKFSKT